MPGQGREDSGRVFREAAGAERSLGMPEGRAAGEGWEMRNPTKTPGINPWIIHALGFFWIYFSRSLNCRMGFSRLVLPHALLLDPALPLDPIFPKTGQVWSMGRAIQGFSTFMDLP